MRETLEYTRIDGNKTDKNITVFALSTCGFCKKGLEYLQEKKIGFKYIYIDNLPVDTKRELKDELVTLSGKRVAFPFVSIDDSVFLVGFVEEDWKDALGL